jgi:ABC-type multidrug transport system fused ATPase/permease subunit
MKSRFHLLGKIVLKHKYQLLITYILFTLEMVGLLLRPFFLSKAVNDLLQNSYNGLIYLIVAHVIWLIAGTIRHMYDTRTYTAIYNSLVGQLFSKSYGKEEVSKLSAHSTLSREFIDFLEFDLNYVVEAIYNLLGSMIMLFFYNKKVVLLCFLMLIPVMIISFFYGKKMQKLTQYKNDELEKQVEIITTQNQNAIKNHYNLIRKWQVKISDKEAWNFGVLELIALSIIIISLLVTVNDGKHFSLLAGDIIGIYNYVLKFISGIDTIPYSFQRLTSLKDIVSRIEFGDD